MLYFSPIFKYSIDPEVKMLYGDCSYQLTEHSGGTCKEEAKINFSLEGSGANDSCLTFSLRLSN